MPEMRRCAEPAAVIDARLSRYQVGVFCLCAMVVFLDGIDTQVAGIAAPLFGREFGIAKSLFGWIFAAGTLGATIGALGCGIVADRIGRRRTLIGTTIAFGLCTLATARADSFEALIAWRFATGVGLGGAVPCFVALTSEYAPARHRAAIVSLLWAAFPLGAALGALVNSYIVAAIGWRPLFVVWGVAPLLVALVHLRLLPESVSFLLAHGRHPQKARAILARIDPAAVVVLPAGPVAASPAVASRGSLAALFTPALRAASVSLAATALILFGLLTVAASWMPALLTPYGFSPAAGALVVAASGLGSFFGTTGAGLLLERIGVAWTTLPAVAGAALALVLLGGSTGSFGAVTTASFAAGLCLGLGSSSVIALAALAYPTEVRSTGVGLAMGAGRFGAVVMPLVVGQLVNADLSIGAIMGVLAAIAAAAAPCILMLSVRRVGARQVSVAA